MPSATVPTANQSEHDVLDVRARSVRRSAAAARNLPPLLRRNGEAFRLGFSGAGAGTNSGLVVETGGSMAPYPRCRLPATFKRLFPDTIIPGEGRLIATDIVPTRHCDLAADAMALPFSDGSVDNLVMMDVLHHIPFPLRFLAEADRVLRPGGRVVMTEPYISPASRIIFAVGHPEPVVSSAKVFGDLPASDPSPLRGTGAFASNQATPTLLFFRDRALFETRFPTLRLLHRFRRSLFVYPLSGGFSGPKLIPRFLAPIAWAVEWLLTPLAPLLACRLLVVIEKSSMITLGLPTPY